MLELSEITASLREGATEQGCIAVCRRRAKTTLQLADADIVRVDLHRKSVDARKKSNVHFILSARVELACHIDENQLVSSLDADTQRHIRIIDGGEPSFPAPVAEALRPSLRPVVVGAGCAGLFAALTLAKAGLHPLLIERGHDACRRTADIERFNTTAALDPESNIQFGLGGAGTFSDGKLTTGTKNPLHRLILQTLVTCGAPREILWDAKPHIGSDILPTVVTNIVERIEQLGGEIRFETKLTDIERTPSGAIKNITVARNGSPEETLAVSHLILACGHSARDVFSLLDRRGLALARKTFAMGVRIEHLQRDIDRAQYGSAAGHPALGAAPYKLVAHLAGGRSLFSFCMCPGGQVVAAASEPGGVVTNGASLYARDGLNANAALLVNINPGDLPGEDPLAGIELQRRCEMRAFELGGGSYRAPAQLVGDFLAGRASESAASVSATYPLGVTWTKIDPCLPQHVAETLRVGIPALDRKLRGFNDTDAVLTAIESRSSSPITVVRDKECHAVGAEGLYPCGEGAGYAGGIMSAATDGIRCAQALIADLTSAQAL